MLQGSCSARSHSGGQKKTLMNSVPNVLIGIGGQIENAIHWWWSKEVTKLWQNGKENERKWANCGETIVELRGSTGRVGISFVVSVFAICSQDVLHLSETRARGKIGRSDREAVWSRAMVECMLEWIRAEKAVEFVASVLLIGTKVKQMPWILPECVKEQHVAGCFSPWGVTVCYLDGEGEPRKKLKKGDMTLRNLE